MLDLFELLLFLLTAFSGLSDAFELDLVLALAFFALSSLSFPLCHLILLPFRHFSGFFSLFLLFNPALLFFLLGSYTHDLLLFFPCGFLGGSAPFLLLLLLFFPFSFGFFTLGSESLHGIDAFGFLGCLLLFFFPACVGLGPRCKSLFIGLPPGFHELELFLNLLVFLICYFFFLPFLGSLGLSSLISIFRFDPLQGLLFVLQSLINCFHLGAMGTSLFVFFLLCKLLLY